MRRVTVVGAGLAGSEAAWQLANRGIPVRLVEMRPVLMTPAHTTDRFGELVCSNSLGADVLTSPAGAERAAAGRRAVARIEDPNKSGFWPNSRPLL